MSTLRRPRNVIIVLVLCLVVAVPFLPAIRGGLTNWDDDINITSNPCVHAGVRDGLWPLLTRPYVRLYVPLTYGIWWAEYHLWGEAGTGYHVVNLLCHVAAVALLYSILRSILACRWAAIVAAAWWGVHPLQAEPVGWITGLKDVLSVLLALVCWRLYIAWRAWPVEPDTGRSAEGTTEKRHGRCFRWLPFAGALTAYLLACMAKPGVVLFPLVLAAHDLFIGRRRLRELTPLWAFLAPAVLVGVLTLVIHDPSAAGVVQAPTFLGRLAVAGDSVAFYLEKSLLPTDLCPVYGRAVADACAMPVPWINLGVLASVLLLVLWPGSRWKLAAVLLVAGVLPVSGILSFGYQAYSTVADRYGSFATMAVALAFGDILARLNRRAPRARVRDMVFVSVSLAVVLLFANLTWEQSGVWRNSLTIWERVMQCNTHPTASVLSNYGSALVGAGRPEEAVAVLQRCVETNSTHVLGRYNLGRALQAVGRPEAARAAYVRVLELDPTHVNAWVAMGFLEAQEGRYAASAAASRRALGMDPQNVMAAVNLGMALLELNQPAEAVAPLRLVIARMPQDLDARFHLGLAYERAGEQDLARVEFRQVAEAPNGAVKESIRREAVRKLGHQ